MKLILKGESSHASQPEKGNSPVLAFTAIIEALHTLPKRCKEFEDAALITIVYATLGKEAFGTSPGEAEIMATLRSYKTIDLASKINRSYVNLENPFPWSEDFAHFGKKYPSVLIGFGAGENHAPLHSVQYDFPDEIILPTVDYLYNLINHIKSQLYK